MTSSNCDLPLPSLIPKLRETAAETGGGQQYLPRFVTGISNAQHGHEHTGHWCTTAEARIFSFALSEFHSCPNVRSPPIFTGCLMTFSDGHRAVIGFWVS